VTKTPEPDVAATQVKMLESARPRGRFPTEGRQGAYKSYVSASLNARQTPEQFGGISTE
jgi:hypothetical protein